MVALLVVAPPAPPTPVLLPPPPPVVADDVSPVDEVLLVVSLLEHAVREAMPSVITRKALQVFMATTLSRGRR